MSDQPRRIHGRFGDEIRGRGFPRALRGPRLFGCDGWKKAWQQRQYAHMCRDGHIEIGHNDSESEMCPLCVSQAKLAAAETEKRTLLARVVQVESVVAACVDAERGVPVSDFLLTFAPVRAIQDQRQALGEAEAERARLERYAKVDDIAFSSVNHAAVSAETKLEALTTALSALSEQLLTWAQQVEDCAEGMHAGVNSAIQEMRQRADELAALLATHPEQP